MLKAPISPDDDARIASLLQLQLLDTPIEERFERITRIASRALNMPIVAFTLVDALRQTFKSVQGMHGQDVSREISFCGHVVAGGEEMLIVPDARLDPRFSDNPMVACENGVNFYAGCPVHAPDGQKIGVLCAIDKRPREFDAEQIKCMKEFTAMVEAELHSFMLSKAQHKLLLDMEPSKRAALIDQQTKMWNRAGVALLLPHEWQSAAEQQNSLAVVMAEVDHFEKIITEQGQPVTDEAIKYVAHQLLTKLRADDVIARYDDRRFMMVLTKCAPSQLKMIVERFRALFDNNLVSTSAGHIPVTLSFGAACTAPGPGRESKQLVEQADKALSKAKKQGGNRVEIAD